MVSRAVPAALRLLLVSLLLVVVAPPQASLAVVVKSKSPSPKPKPKPKTPPPKAKSPPPKPKSPPPKSPAKPPVRPPPPSFPPPSPRPQPGTACNPSSAFGGATVTMSRCVNMPQGGTFSFAMPSLTSLSVLARAPPALPYGWVAFGVSATCGMVGSHVFIAYANSEDSSKIAVGAYSLVSKVPGSAIAPLDSAAAGFSLTSTPAVEATANGTGYAVRFDIQFELFKILNYVNNGVVCIVTARGPALTAAQFAQQPVPGFQKHDWAKVIRLNLLDGTITY